MSYADLVPRLGLKVSVHGHSPEHIHPDILFPHVRLDARLLGLFRDQARLAHIEPGLFIGFSQRTIQILLVLVDLAARKAPTGSLLPSLDQKHLIHGIIQQDRATHRHAGLVREELGEGRQMLILREGRKERTMLEDAQTEATKGHGREGRIQRSNEILVEPLGLLDLEAYSLDRAEFFLREIDDETDT